jgi:DNA-binding NarL/FixJ family response regulator
VRQLKILIVDDSPQMRRLIRTFVEDLSSEVIECSGGEEAVGAYFTAKPDVVLMDIRMPDGNGLRAAHAIHARDAAARIVIVTHLDGDELRRAAADAGAIGYVSKDNLLAIRRLLTTP